jgi:hypothetical protein
MSRRTNLIDHKPIATRPHPIKTPYFSLNLLVIAMCLALFGMLALGVVNDTWLITGNLMFVLSYIIFEKTKHHFHLKNWQILTLLIGYVVGCSIFILTLARSF